MWMPEYGPPSSSIHVNSEWQKIDAVNTEAKKRLTSPAHEIKQKTTKGKLKKAVVEHKKSKPIERHSIDTNVGRAVHLQKSIRFFISGILIFNSSFIQFGGCDTCKSNNASERM